MQEASASIAFIQPLAQANELPLVHLAVAARTDVGRIRKGNEDSLHASANAYRGLFIVADGMGGHAAGEVASGIAGGEVRPQAPGPHQLVTARPAPDARSGP